MLIFLLLLTACAQFSVGISQDTVACPMNCTCIGYREVTVDCQNGSHSDDEQLLAHLDSWLYSKVDGRPESLKISNTTLTHVPHSLCRLATLRRLSLDYNRLTRLPDNCFNNLTNLTSFSASDNRIKTLQDGVFDGLTKLQHLYLSRNNLSSIGLSVFATSSNLSNLFYINLSQNNLTTLEPWIYDRGIIGNFDKVVRIDLTQNQISQFTNKMGHTAELCHDNIPYVYVYLFNNRINHIMDIFNGWQSSILELSNCFKLKNGEFNLQIVTGYSNIACDCEDYAFYKIIRLQYFPRWWTIHNCNLTDPLTKKSSIVNIYDVDLSLIVCEVTEHCPSGCVCVYRPANSTLHIYCSNTNLTTLPPEVPELPDSRTKYKLDFSNNRLLHRLEYRDYFVNTSILDVSNSAVSSLSEWEEIAKIPDINLFGNKIKSLPLSFVSINVTTSNLDLANNPWVCSCDNKWMKDWFSSVADRLKHDVLCDSPSRLRGTNIIEISDKEFCVDPASEAGSEAVRQALRISLSSAVSVLAALVSAGIIVYRLRVKLYSRWKFHPFDRDECLGENMEYDVFLSCSSLDDDPHGMRIVELIESKGYRVCYHERDFIPGGLILENIGNGIERSKRTVCLLSQNFLQSAYCMHEFKVAYHHNIIEKGKKRLIVLMMLENPNDFLANDDDHTAVLRQFLRQYTYIDYTSDDWLDKLLYALPLHGLLQQN